MVEKLKKLEENSDEYFIPKSYRIDKRTQQTDDEFMFRFNVPLEHDPGQFVQVSIPGLGESPISICSCNDNYFELSIREVGTVTKALAKLKEGDKVGLRGPYGRGYKLEPLKGNNVFIIGGGCGVAPVRGIIEYIQKNRNNFGDVVMYFGFREPKEILFKEDFEKWQKDCTLKITVDKPDQEWKGPVGVITKLIEADKFDNKNKVVFICGPPIMIKFVIQTLKNRGFNDDQIFISNERMMKCGTGMCGHCMIEGKYTCRHGPVFRYDEVKNLHG